MVGGQAAAATGGFGLPIDDELAQTISIIGFADDSGTDAAIIDDRQAADVRQGHAYVALAIAWATLFVVGTDLFVVSPLLPLIAADFGVSSQSAGLSVMAFALAYMLSAPFLGHVADRYGRHRVLGGCLAGFVVANLLTAAAPNLGALVAARVLAGSMAAGVTPSIYALVGEHAPSGRRGTWLAVAVSGLLMSLSLGAPIGTLAGARFGWPPVFIAFSAMSVALLGANRSVWPKPRALCTHAATSPPQAAATFQRLGLTVLWSTALYSMYTYLGTGLIGVGFTADQIAETILLYGVGAVAGNLIGGRLADRLGAHTVIGLSLFSLGLGFVVLRFALQTGQLIGPALCFASVAAQLFFPAQQAGLASDFPNRRASMLAWNNAALFLGISLGSLVGGQAVGLGGFTTDVAFSCVAAFAGWLMHFIASAGATQPAWAAGKASP